MSELYGSIKIDNGVRKIGVNDNGDYIELSVNDRDLHMRFAELMKWFDEKQKQVGETEKELSKKYGNAPVIAEEEDGTVTVNTSAVVDITAAETDIYKECCEKIDYVFGENTCKKVFGNVIPDFKLIMEFFEQMTPVLKKLSMERAEKIGNRYSRRQISKKQGKTQRSKEELIADYKGK